MFNNTLHIDNRVLSLFTLLSFMLLLVACDKTSENTTLNSSSTVAEGAQTLDSETFEKQRRDEERNRLNNNDDENRGSNNDREDIGDRDRESDENQSSNNGDGNHHNNDREDRKESEESENDENNNVTIPPISNQTPNGIIVQPASNITINPGESISISGSGQDPDNHYPLSYHWDFAGAAPVQNVANPGIVTFNSTGDYLISLTVTDSLGLADPTPAIRLITVNNIVTSNQAPIAKINNPISGTTINVGGTLYFDSLASDPDNNLPLAYLWNFDGALPNTNATTPGNITFPTAGNYNIRLTVTDSLGLASITDSVQIDVLENTGGGTPPPPPNLNTSHAGRFTIYEGSKTCINCHQTEVHEVHASVHYQWQGPAPDVTNISHGGKLGGINDFCGFPDINFIGQITNLDNQLISAGCATCHVGMGAKPEVVATTAQLNNIDCLVCHSDNYKRKVEQQADGSYHFVAAPEDMTTSVLEAITDIKKTPSRGTCINCHSYAGGGSNNKRGDLEAAHRQPPSANFDVHMADQSIGGAGLNCIDCHTTQQHKFAGRGTDLRPTELNIKVTCTNCHNSKPHNNNNLDKHTAKVDCSVCHIPQFAKIVATDMMRDYSKPAVIDQEKRLYEPSIVRQSNVRPVYRFNNGTSWIYEFGTAVKYASNGLATMAEPLGNRTDPNAKIYPFKRHLARLPFDSDTQRLLPIKLGILFQTGNINEAIIQGTAEVGWPLNSGVSFVDTERYMGISHEVSPKAAALNCDDCHGNPNGMNFVELGYAPKATRNGRPLCSSCHGSESSSFTSIHSRHVDNLNIDCSQCHNF